MLDDLYTRYYHDPNRFARDVMGVHLWSKQREILDAVFQKKKVTVRSCHSAGKTFIAAVVVLCFLYLRTPCKIVTTAPTWYQVKDLLWSEINRLYKSRMAKTCPGIPLKSRLNIRDDWFATGISPKEATNFQGFHQRHVLVVFDESPGVDEKIFEGADSLMASGDAHFLQIGNPTEASGHFYDSFKDSSYTPFAISAYDTPNFTGEDVPDNVRRSLVSQEWVEEKKRKWREDSPLFQSRVLGVFPKESEYQVISLSDCEKAVIRDMKPEGDMELGVDVARFGDDLTVYTVRQGLNILDILTDAKRDNMHIAGRIGNLHRQYGFKHIKVDEIGLGSGVVDRAKELKLPVIGVNSANEPRDKEMYLNKRVEMWFNTSDWIREGSLPARHEYVDDMVADLVAPRYKYNSKGLYQLESKDETKKRIGRSPDFGDSCVLATQDEKKGRPGGVRVYG